MMTGVICFIAGMVTGPIECRRRHVWMFGNCPQSSQGVIGTEQIG
jgi:hypothetical protein